MVIYPHPNEDKKARFGFSYNWALLATVLNNADSNVIVHDYSCEEFDENVFFSQFTQEQITLVILEFDSFALKRSENDQHGIYLVKYIRKHNPKTKIIAYGYYCCLTGIDILGADITIKENNINLILSSIHKLDQNFSLIQYETFDNLPFINRLMLYAIPFFHEKKSSTLIQTAKGCENSCIFCQRKGWQSHYVMHSNNYIYREFEYLEAHNFKNIWIIDENFTFHLGRAKDILQGLIDNGTTRNMKISISSWANIDQEFLDMASKANIKTISFGIETGNDEILQFYRKKIDLKKVKPIIQYANSIGIFTVGNFIIGAPMETENTVKETFSFITECGFDEVHIKTLDYMIGSELYENLDNTMKSVQTHFFACKENGLTNFYLDELKKKKEEFLRQYKNTRKQELMRKIDSYGRPFDPLS
jgi:radical SAM superfamily enzyme YgiQ (UPF0313 family)